MICSDTFSVGKHCEKDDAVSKQKMHGSDGDGNRVNGATMDNDALKKHRRRATAFFHNVKQSLMFRSKSESSLFVNSHTSSENYLLDISHIGARKLLLGEYSFERKDSEQTDQTTPWDDSINSAKNYIADSQADASPEVQAKAPSHKRPRRMSDPVFNSALRSCHGPNMSDPAINQPLRSCLKYKDSSSSNSLSSQNSVHFGTINIREYLRSITDNPSITEGPPIGIDWDYYTNETKVMVDEYEDLHPTRRTKDEFHMPARVREEMLIQEWGHTMRDIRQASAESKEIRHLREKALHTNKVSEKLTEVIESSRRKWHRLKTGTTKEMEQEKLWKDASKWLDTNSDEIST
jgi:hypothetical protein